ncbi:hypothetical protein [Emticicia sp. W12TSBA100-4]|uniref:hypothetical protein n=1 Tax=Emticicia sp. W12TSBA100-4 TaxID=3160965 RepID=UPI0033057B4A
MKTFKAFIFFSVMTTIGFVVYYFFEQDWQSIWAFINGKSTVNPLKKYAFYNLFTVGTVSVHTNNSSTANNSTANSSTANNSTANNSTANNSTANNSTANSSTANSSTTNNSSTAISSATGSGSDFRFVEKSNGKSFPDKPQGNSYTFVHFPSHCRVCTPVETTPMNAFAHCEYGLKNSSGEEIVHLLDTIGGFHPNFFDVNQRSQKGNDYYKWVDNWASEFKPFGNFNNPIDRGNNHFDAYKKYLIDGSYTFWYRNKSNTRHSVTAGFIRATNGEGDLNVIVEPYGYVEKVLNISSNGDEYDPYKINTNNYIL